MNKARLEKLEALWNPSDAHVEELIAAVRARDARIAELEAALRVIVKMTPPFTPYDTPNMVAVAKAALGTP